MKNWIVIRTTLLILTFVNMAAFGQKVKAPYEKQLPTTEKINPPPNSDLSI